MPRKKPIPTYPTAARAFTSRQLMAIVEAMVQRQEIQGQRIANVIEEVVRISRTPGAAALLTTGQLSRFWGVAARVIASWIDDGSLSGFRLPNSLFRRVYLSDAIAFAGQHGLPADHLCVLADRLGQPVVRRVFLIGPVGYDQRPEISDDCEIVVFDRMQPAILSFGCRPASIVVIDQAVSRDARDNARWFLEQRNAPRVIVLLNEDAVGEWAGIETIRKPCNWRRLLQERQPCRARN